MEISTFLNRSIWVMRWSGGRYGRALPLAFGLLLWAALANGNEEEIHDKEEKIHDKEEKIHDKDCPINDHHRGWKGHEGVHDHCSYDPEERARAGTSDGSFSRTGQATEKARAKVKNQNSAEPNPLEDLASWLRGSKYHERFSSSIFETEPEPTTNLENPLAGPGATSSYYGKLVGMLDPSAQANAPPPLKLLESLELLWASQWQRNLGFDADPESQQLAHHIERAQQEAHAAQRSLTGLLKRIAACEATKLQLHDQIASAGRLIETAAANLAGLRAQLDRRMLFIQAIADALRLAPDGGFGPTLREANWKAVQASAARILARIGPLSAETVWKGLALEVAWLAEHENIGVENTSDMQVRRRQATEAAQALLLDPRLDGLGAVCGFIREYPLAPPSVLRKAFELLDRLGTLNLRPETLATLPQLLAHVKNAQPGAAERARWVLLRILGVRAGKVSMEDAVRYLAPLVEAQDMQLAEAAHAFLNYHTGQNLPRDAQAWLALHQRMKTEREKIKTEQDKVASRK